MSGKTRATATLPFLLVLTLALGLGQVWAQEGDTPEVDPPDRAARLSIIEGNVTLQPAGEQSWAPAMLNRPLTTGDKIYTERDARAEIQVARAAIRLADDTEFSFQNLDDERIQMRLTNGVMRVNVRALNNGERMEVATPNITLSLLQPGTYRVEVYDSGETTVVKVSDGEAKVTGPSQNVMVRAGHSVSFTGTDKVTAEFYTLGEPDEFDTWTGERERRDYLASSRSEYVSPDVTGYQDLEEHGTWSTDPTYGNVWTPSNVGVGWSPYSYGRWAWVAPWGWTWVDNSPWGYAPYHYGRWAHVSNRWCWVPGPRHVRPVYAPALVGWNDSRHGYVSWFPLGPGDVYSPNGRYSRRYLERVNMSNTQVARTALEEVIERRARGVKYHNRAAPGAVTTVARETFTSAEQVGDRRIRVDDQNFSRSRATTESPDIAPVIASRLGGTPNTRMRTAPPPTYFERSLSGKRLPPSSAPKRHPNPERPAREVTTLNQPSESPREARGSQTQMDAMRAELARRAAEQQQQQQQRETGNQARWQRQESRSREQQQQQYRESVRRAQETLRQTQPREQPRVSQPSQPRIEQPRVSQPAQPRVSQPAQPRSQPSYKPAESRPAPAPRASTPRSNEPRAARQ
jgi:hypothetical protein